MVAANTASPMLRDTGKPSPVIVFWSIMPLPCMISPSTGIISPGYTITESLTTSSLAGSATTSPSRTTHAVRDWNSSSSVTARFEPAAVRSRIQSPRRISHVITPPVTMLPCPIDAEIASVSRKSTFRRRSRLHTCHAREKIG